MRTPHIYSTGNFYKYTFHQGGGLPIFQGHIRKRGGGKIGDFMKKVGQIITPLGKRILKKVKKPVIKAALESGRQIIQGQKPSQVLKKMTKKHAPNILINAAEGVLGSQRQHNRVPKKRRKKKRGGGVRLNQSQKGKTVKKNIFNE